MRSVLLASMACLLVACPGRNGTDADADVSTTDAVTDRPATDAGPPAHIADLNVDSMGTLMGLDGRVDVVQDTYGWPHIYGTTLHDVAAVQGLMAGRERMPQMELLRRLSSGTLAEAFGSLSPDLIDDDIAIRVVGLRRAAQLMWTQIQANAATDPQIARQKTMLEAFTVGVNAYLEEIRSGRARTPTGTELVVSDATPDWTPVDSLVIGRYQSYSLSYDVDDDIHLSAFRDAAHTTFDTADMTTQPDRYARRGFFSDMALFRPSTDAAIVPDFYTSMAHSGRSRRRRQNPAIPRSLYARIDHVLQRTRAVAERLGDESRGSNNWVVSGMASANGHALLANDPHLSLTSPSVFWGVHITVTQGPDALNEHGVSFPGIHGVVIGYNDSLAWGVTTADYDVTDAYLETITPGAGGGADTVLHNGAQVPIETIHEMIPDGFGHVIDTPIEVVPHHGPILPTVQNHAVVPRTATSAISVRWTGHQATNELGAFLGLAYAHNVAEAMPAIDNFGVGAQNFVVADTTGQIGYSSSCLLPIRPPAALTWSPTNVMGTAPAFVLPGTGEADWNGYVDRQLIPHAIGTPTQRYIATANNDQAGTAFDNNPFNDRVFLASSYDDGFRARQILDRLAMLNNQAHVTDMSSIQGDHAMLIGGRYRPFIASAMANLQAEWTTPGTHPDLAVLAASLLPRRARLENAAMRLASWTLDSPAGTETAATAQNRSDAVATSIFHGWIVRFLDLALADEFEAIGLGRGAYRSQRMRSALFLLEHPDQAATRDASGESVLWDDITTPAHETRDAIIVQALDEAMTQLETRFMTSDVDMWLWGTVHTLRLDSIVPGPGALLSIPPPSDHMFPNGFPRAGGLHVVDASNPGVDNFDFSYGSGPTQRYVIEMDPAGPRAFNALPGGEIFNTQSPHHADEMNNYWRLNQVHPLPHTEAEVITAYERHYVFMPQ